MKPNPVLASLILISTGIVFFSGCQSKTAVEVVDLNKVLDIYDQVVKSKEDPSIAESEPLSDDASKDNASKDNASNDNASKDNASKDDASKDDAEDTKAFLKLFAEELNKASLIKSPIGVDIQSSGSIRGFVDGDKNGIKDLSSSKEPELFTIVLDKDGKRIIATQTVAGQQYRRDHHYGSTYGRYYYYHRMHNAMWHRQNSYYTSSRPRPNYSSLNMSSPNYHASAVSKAQSAARTSSRSSSRSSARGFSRSGSFSSGK